MNNKIVIAGGTGFLGRGLADHYSANGSKVIILTRGVPRKTGNIEYLQWDAKHLDIWVDCLEGATALINLTGKSVDCRYTKANKQEIYASRLESTAVLGEALLRLKVPPKVWMNAASATIYRHSFDKEMDETSLEFGSGFSVDVCRKWEEVFNTYAIPGTRKIIMRTGIVIGKNGGPLKPLKMLAKIGVGGKQGNGKQYVSWLHENDFINIVDFFIANESTSGIYNLTAPKPIPNNEFMKALRSAVGADFGVPLPKWLLEIGAFIIRTETELILKSRRVTPKRLLEAGYRFRFETIEKALTQLVPK